MDLLSILLEIERLRRRLYRINPQDKEKLLRASRRLDRLVVKFQRHIYEYYYPRSS
ncbi:aspartyl-phosphate phosphatase Spo0E family protein [Desulfovirgula thermocuniculi]|uniref:aspartyl-phosphate phosphatase Spo0E family protein n=1 Tax=Desulfovirgula thermocuniculi TaxID=348842 RepID=UPI0012EB13CA|nr:aspartyl-phosphate phosphatase Spo0E family protein [Desulfovirgula thermocuniculi]